MMETEILFTALGVYLDPLLMLARITVACMVLITGCFVMFVFMWFCKHLVWR